MKRLILTSLLATACLCAAIRDVRTTGTTATQAVLAFTAPTSAACAVDVSESPGYSPLVHDVNGNLFAGANLDSRSVSIVRGLERTFVVGKRTVEQALDGRNYSRALQAYTLHYYRITCGSDTSTGTFRTQSIPFGHSYQDQRPNLTPTADFSDRSKWYIDPQTGMALKAITGPGDATGDEIGVNFNTAAELSGGNGTWSNPGNALTIDSSRASFTGSGSGTQKWAYFRVADLLLDTRAKDSYTQAGRTIDWIIGLLTGNTSRASCTTSSTDPECQVEACLTTDGGVTCKSDIKSVPLPSTTDATVNICGSLNCASPVAVDTWSPKPIHRTEIATHAGSLNIGSDAVTLTNTAWDSEFNPNWVAGSKIVVGGAECTIAAVDPGNGNKLIVNACGLTANANGVAWTAPNFGILLRKKTATADTINIDALSFKYRWSRTTYIYAAGAINVFNRNLLNGGYLARIPDGYGEIVLHWVHATDFTSYSLGSIASPVKSSGSNTWGANWRLYNSKSAFSFTDSRVIYGFIPDSTGRQVLMRVRYNGTPSADVVSNENQASSSFGVTNCTSPTDYERNCDEASWKVLTPSNVGGVDRSFKKQIADFLAASGSTVTFDTAVMDCNIGSETHDGYLGIECFNTQDSRAWAVAFALGDENPANAFQSGGPRVIAAMPTWAYAPVRHCTDHGAGLTPYNPGYFTIFGKDYGGGGNYGVGPLVVKTASTMIPADSNPITVTVDATLNDLYDPNPHALESGAVGGISRAQIGDLFRVGLSETNAPYPWSEIMQLTAKTGNQWTLSRNYHNRGVSGIGPAVLYLHATCGIIDKVDANAGGVYWKYLANPTGADPAGFEIDPNGQGGHGTSDGPVILQGVPGDFASNVNAPAGCLRDCYEWRSSTEIPTIPGYFNVQKKTAPKNAVFTMIPGSLAGSWFQSHAGPPPENAPNLKYVTDGAPLIWTFADAARISGSLYKINNTSLIGGNPDAVQLSPFLEHAAYLKRTSTLVHGSWKVFRDISSAATGNIIDETRTHDYQYCIARAANECRTGSVAGDTYVNAPYLTITGSTTYDFTRSLDLTITTGFTGMIGEISWARSEALGYGMRPLTSAFNYHKGNTSFWNARFLPSGQAIVVNSFRFSDFGSHWLLGKVPPRIEDSVDRTTFIPVSVTVASAPAGTSRLVAKFGYVENGSPTDGYCQSRQEACYAVASTVNVTNPFQWNGELTSSSGVACASGCTVAIPAISQRALYYQLQYRNSGGNTVARGPWTAMAVR